MCFVMPGAGDGCYGYFGKLNVLLVDFSKNNILSVLENKTEQNCLKIPRIYIYRRRILAFNWIQKKHNWNSVSGRFIIFRYAQMKTKWSQARWGLCCFQESGMETSVQYGHQDLSVNKPTDVDQVFPAVTIQYVWGLWWQEDYRMNNI